MRKLEVNKMENLNAGFSNATACGIGAGALAVSLVGGPVGVIWGFAAFATFCLRSDK